jgi:hypothetical protein
MNSLSLDNQPDPALSLKLHDVRATILGMGRVVAWVVIVVMQAPLSQTTRKAQQSMKKSRTIIAATT